MELYLEFMMPLVFYFVFLLLSCLPLYHSATVGNTSKPICPKTFICENFPSFEYPFYNTSDTRCGLVKIDCHAKLGAEIYLQDDQPYKIISKLGPSNTILVHNKTFQDLVKRQDCAALMNNFTSTRPLFFSFAIQPFITLFKCAKNPVYGAETGTYFEQKPDYYNYTSCPHHNLYYDNLISREVPTDLPQSCEVIQLPVILTDVRTIPPNKKSLFSLLSSQYTITIYVSRPCNKCHKREGQCQIHRGNFQCVDAKEERRKLILISVLSGFSFIFMLSSAIFIIQRRCRRNLLSYFSSKNNPRYIEDGSVYFGVPVFSYTELENATQHFDPSQELGDGGFGAVYYGKLRDGREVAVKRLYEHNYKRVQHFINEIEILTRLRHQNLVVLYGCTSYQSRELLLVYEYIPNGTVADHLHGERANPRLLTWPIRMNIAIETAKALVFLHASEIIHRDVKTSNILLDHNFCVKVADFGISRLLPNDVTHVSTAPQGTPGYVDPEYHQCYQLTDKSDVYSFGVVLIELISSMQAVDINRSRDEINLANLAINRIQRCEFDQLIDPFLGSDSNAEIEMMTTLVAELAFRCLQFESEIRPTMNEVLDLLKEIQALGDVKLQSPPSHETEDVVLLKDHPPLPVSVSNKWYSINS